MVGEKPENPLVRHVATEKPSRPPAPGRTLIITKRPAPMLVEDLPIKKPKSEKGALFYLLPLDILNDIDTWIIDLEYNDTHKAVVL